MKRHFRQLARNFLRCRTLGHMWDEITGTQAAWQPKVVYIDGQRFTFRCESCTMQRREVWSKGTGEMIYRTYKPPKGYKLDMTVLPEGVTPREAFRMEWAGRKRDRVAARRAS